MRRLLTIIVHALAAAFGRWAPPPWLRWIDSRLVLVSDLGILSKETADGGHDVFVQSIQTGKPVAGAHVQVIGRNGQPLHPIHRPRRPARRLLARPIRRPPRSHGCINLAKWLFGFTQPTLAEGDTEITATEKRPGTVVRVR